MKALNSTKLLLTLLGFALISPGVGRSAGSIPIDDPKLLSYITKSELATTLLDAGLSLNTCEGIRLGRHWRSLAGTRIGPYQCMGSLREKLVTLIIETQVSFIDEQGHPVEDDDAFELAVGVVEKPTFFKLEETLLKHR